MAQACLQECSVRRNHGCKEDTSAAHELRVRIATLPKEKIPDIV
ncbi:MAG TPA: hypothetical protein VJZ69_00130 [Clostridia bacterium]|nr:hypothetical protein [Clostridia bacterium]